MSGNAPSPVSCSFAFGLRLTVQQILSRTNAICQLLRETSREIGRSNIAGSTQQTFGHTFGKWHLTEGKAAEWACRCVLGSMVHTDQQVRGAFNQAKVQMKQCWDEVYTDRSVYRVLRQINSGHGNNTPSLLSDVDQKMMVDTLQLFERNGAALNHQDSERFRSIKQRIGQLEAEFQRNLNEDDKILEYSEEELQGLSEAFIQSLDITRDSGKFRVNVKAPHLSQLMKFCKQPRTRERHMKAAGSRCHEQNMPILVELIELRRAAAKLLGYKSWADYKINSNTMAGSADTVQVFVSDLMEKLRAGLQRDLNTLGEFKRKDINDSTGKLDAWDLSFYDNVAMKQLYSVDQAKLKEYFPLDFVIERILEIYQHLFDLKFEEMPYDDQNVWHPDVRAFQVTDRQSSNVIGHFYLDLFARPGKYSHQCVLPIAPAYKKEDGQVNLPAAANISNLTKPAPNQPSLLLHGEVRTFFHEFGHVIHCICTRSPYTMLSWAWSAVPYAGGVEMDFLEVPSQMLENWLWEKEILQLISISPSLQTTDHRLKHQSSAKDKASISPSPDPLPEKEIKDLLRTRFALSSIGYTRQLFMTLYDLKVHSLMDKDPPVTAEQLIQWWNEMYRDAMQTIEPVQDTYPMANWYHIAMGYDAGYYGYIWSEVISLDMYFSRWEGRLLDQELGKEYRRMVLEPGATIKGKEMSEQFLLGRQPSIEPLLKAILS